MGFFDFLDFFKDDPEAVLARKEREIKDEASELRDFSITCNCGTLAVPILNTGNVYRCIKCSKQFANTRHGLEEYDDDERSWYYYDEAVELMKLNEIKK